MHLEHEQLLEQERVENEQWATNGDGDAQSRWVSTIMVVCCSIWVLLYVFELTTSTTSITHSLWFDQVSRWVNQEAGIDGRRHGWRSGSWSSCKCGWYDAHVAIVRVRVIVVVEEVVRAGHFVSTGPMQIRNQIRPQSYFVRAVVVFHLGFQTYR